MIRFRTLSLAASAAFIAAPLHAQTSFPTNDATIQRIWRLGMDSSQVQPLAQALFDSVGPRLTGSPGILAASNWVIGKYKSWGIDARREQSGPGGGGRRGAPHIVLVPPPPLSLEG